MVRPVKQLIDILPADKLLPGQFARGQSNRGHIAKQQIAMELFSAEYFYNFC